jgi:hypothetical protein
MKLLQKMGGNVVITLDAQAIHQTQHGSSQFANA